MPVYEKQQGVAGRNATFFEIVCLLTCSGWEHFPGEFVHMSNRDGFSLLMLILCSVCWAYPAYGVGCLSTLWLLAFSQNWLTAHLWAKGPQALCSHLTSLMLRSINCDKQKEQAHQFKFWKLAACYCHQFVWYTFTNMVDSSIWNSSCQGWPLGTCDFAVKLLPMKLSVAPLNGINAFIKEYWRKYEGVRGWILYNF